MFSNLRDPQGRFSLLMSGIACLLLALFLAPAMLSILILVPIALAVTGIVCIVIWWRRKEAERYDLKRLFEEPFAPEEEPSEDTIPEDEPAVPYCGWCDEANPMGLRRCANCGRELG